MMTTATKERDDYNSQGRSSCFINQSSSQYWIQATSLITPLFIGCYILSISAKWRLRFIIAKVIISQDERDAVTRAGRRMNSTITWKSSAGE